MILVNSVPGSTRDVYAPLQHAPWEGWTFADTIFPAFLWIVGASMAISTGNRLARGDDVRKLLSHAGNRLVLLFAAGVLLEALSGHVRVSTLLSVGLADLKLTGVLQKIAICYFFAFLIFLRSGWRGCVLWIVVLYGAYLGVMLLTTVPHCDLGPWSAQCNAARWLDNELLGDHIRVTENGNDPEGIMSLPSATATVLFGALGGTWIQRCSTDRGRMIWILGAGAALLLLGEWVGLWIPMNKTLWTPSYGIFMSGLASLSFGLFHYLVEVAAVIRWLLPFEIIGRNALVAYVISRLGVLKVHVFGKSLYWDVLRPVVDAQGASLLFGVSHLAVIFAVVLWMWHRGRFLKL
jgi:predicted acyltransferase